MTLGPIYKKGGGGGMGDVTTASNVGTGEELFKQKNGTVLEFRTISGVNGTTITQNGDVLEIDGGSDDITAANIGGEEELFKQKNGDILEFRTLVGVNGTTITQNGDTLEIDGGGGGGGTITGADNVGGANEWFFQNNAGTLEFNTFDIAGGLQANLAANVWTIDATLLSNQINDLSDAISSLADTIAIFQEQLLVANYFLIEYVSGAAPNLTFNSPQEHMYVANGVIPQALVLPVALAGDDGAKITVKNRNTAVASISVSGNGLNIDATGIVNIPTNGSMTFVYSHATTEWFIV